jgi:hypothetical protein
MALVRILVDGYPIVMFAAFIDALSNAGVAEAARKIFVSNIPIRSQPFYPSILNLHFTVRLKYTGLGGWRRKRRIGWPKNTEWKDTETGRRVDKLLDIMTDKWVELI